MKRAVIAITKKGCSLGKRICSELDDTDLFTVEQYQTTGVKTITGSLKEFVPRIFNNYDVLIFIMAAGIVVRVIAESVKDKTTDPGVLVIDDNSRYVISLLSGHIGGANAAAEQVAAVIGAEPVITTASDVNGLISVDVLARHYGCIIPDMDACRKITAMLVNGGRIAIDCEYDIDIPGGYTDSKEGAQGVVYISNKNTVNSMLPYVQLLPQNVVAGIGCKRGTPGEHIVAALRDYLGENRIDPRSLFCLASIDIKSDEQGLLKAAKEMERDVVFFTGSQIAEVEHLFMSSSFVKQATGVGSVCEPCASLAAGKNGRMVAPRKTYDKITIALWEKQLMEKKENNA